MMHPCHSHRPKVFCNVLFIAALILAIPSFSYGQSGTAMLRFSCGQGNEKTEIHIDGKLKGECPLDVQVNEGTRSILFLKPLDTQHEQRNLLQVKIGAGVVKRIEVELPPPQLTDQGKREAEVERQALAKAKLEKEEAIRQKEAEQKRLAEVQLQEEMQRAEAGDMHAQYALARRYARGVGVTQNTATSRSWDKKAAESGHFLSQLLLPHKLTEENFSNGVKLIDLLAHYYKADNLQFEKKSNLVEYLQEPFFLQKQVVSERHELAEYYLGGLIAHSYARFDMGIIFNSPLATVELKSINFVIGSLSKPTIEQNVFGFDIDEQFIDLKSNRVYLMNRILVCARVPDAEPAKYDFYYSSVTSNQRYYSVLPYHCLLRAGVKGSSATTLMVTNWVQKGSPVRFFPGAALVFNFYSSMNR